ncbi:MAG: dGTP triphosphohydrolase [Flavobacteriaceae bacterium]
MQWEQLLSLRRHGDNQKRLRTEQDPTRSGFEVDYDRIIFSSAFRNLQDKTQVIPFSKTDFVHTRLTHSLEVSVVGRSLGRMVGQQLLHKYPELATIGYTSNDFGAIVAAASLAHDIGNPPFGHSGEQAIGDYFSNGKGVEFKNLLTKTQYHDLTHFEGNANGLKILMESRPGISGGLRLSNATLGAFTKYPKASLPYRPTQHVADKKFGFFQAQQGDYVAVASDLGLLKTDNTIRRHPLAYLVEAADDICYTLIDFEDGINLGWISEDYALEYLINLVKDNINTNKYQTLTTKKDRLAYLRALSISTLIQEAAELFMAHEAEIMSGNCMTSLTEKSKYKAQINDIINLSIRNIYQAQEVIEKELKGYQVIHRLLDVFVGAAIRKTKNNASAFDKLALQCLPETLVLPEKDTYGLLLNISSYVASLTDGKALEWYQKMA